MREHGCYFAATTECSYAGCKGYSTIFRSPFSLTVSLRYRHNKRELTFQSFPFIIFIIQKIIPNS